MSRVARRSTTFFSLVFLVAMALLAMRMRTTSAAVARPAVAATADIRPVLIRAGLDPNSLAAAGVASAQVASIVSAFQQGSAAANPSIAQLDSTYTSARAAHDAAQRKVQSGAANSEEISAYSSLAQALASAESQRTAAFDSLFTGTIANLTTAQRAALTAIRANRHREVPIEFLVVSRTEAEWVALRDALSNERITAKHGDPVNATCQSLLGTARANPSVSAARTALDTALTSVATAWNTATEG